MHEGAARLHAYAAGCRLGRHRGVECMRLRGSVPEVPRGPSGAGPPGLGVWARGGEPSYVPLWGVCKRRRPGLPGQSRHMVGSR